MDFYQDLKTVEKKIKELENSKEYIELKYKNRAWAMTKPTEAEQGEWLELKEELAELEKDKDFYQKAILSTNAPAFKKVNKVRKGYTRDDAVESERKFLNQVATYLYNHFDFEKNYPNSNPTFADVMEATGFHETFQVAQYFNDKKENKVEADGMKDSFQEEVWIFLIRLNEKVNSELDFGLRWNSSGKIGIVLQPEMFREYLVRDIAGIICPNEQVEISQSE